LEEAQVVYAAAVGVPDPVLDADQGSPQSDPPPLPEVMRDVARRDSEIRVAQARVGLQAATTEALGVLTRPDLSLTGSLSGRAGGAKGTKRPESDPGRGTPAGAELGCGPGSSLAIVRPSARGIARRLGDAERRWRAADLAVTVRQRLRPFGMPTCRSMWRARPSQPEQGGGGARANYAQADARFKAGLGTSVELADGEALRTDAEIQVAVGEFQVARAPAIVARLIAEEL